MPNTIYRAALTVLTISLLAIPVVASAADTDEKLDSHRIKLLEDNSWDTDAVDANARFAIYVESEMNVTDEMNFIEDNVPGESHGYVIDVFFPAQPVGDMDKPDGLSESEWIQFLEANFWDYEVVAQPADALPPFIDEERTDPPLPAPEADMPTAHTALCQGEGLMIPLDRAFSDYADDVRDYCRNQAEFAGDADLQGEGYVDPVNRSLNPY